MTLSFHRCALLVIALPLLRAWYVPKWPATYQMNRSLLVMPCNTSGPLNPANIIPGGFGIVDIDQGNMEELWAKGHPMNVEELLLQQAQALVAADPDVKPMVYRNRVKAEPFFASIRAKLEDREYSAWFLQFSATPPLPNGTWYSPKCDATYDPPLCSELYHFPRSFPPCDPPHCDCGGKVPCATYMYDWRNANLVVNNQSLIEWWITDVLFGPTAMGAPGGVVKGLFLDDWWLKGEAMECPDTLYADAGLSGADRSAIAAAWTSVQPAIYDSVVNAGGWVFQLFSPWTWWAVCPQPLIHRGSCARDLASYTGGPDAGAELVSFTDMAECAYNSSFPTSMPNLRQDVGELY